MTDAPISLRCTRSSTVYIDAQLAADSWDNTHLPDGRRGVLVLGAVDHDRAQATADAAVRHFYGRGITACPRSAPVWWQLFRCSEDELEWRPAEDAIEPAVLFTAEEVTDD